MIDVWHHADLLYHSILDDKEAYIFSKQLQLTFHGPRCGGLKENALPPQADVFVRHD